MNPISATPSVRNHQRGLAMDRRLALRAGAAMVLSSWSLRGAADGSPNGEAATPQPVPQGTSVTSKAVGSLQLEVLRAQPAARGRAFPPLLLIPGAYHGAWAFEDKLMPFLAARGFDVYAMSLRGHGASGGAELVDNASFDDYVSDVLTVMAELPAAPVLIGHSLGGLLARRVAEQATVRAVMLMASPTPRSMRQAAVRLLARFPLPMIRFMVTGNPDHVYRNSDVLRGLLFGGVRQPDVDTAIQRMLAERESRRIVTDVQSLEFKPSLVPLLAIGGDADIGVPVSALEEAAALHRGSVKVLAGASHEFFLMHGWQGAATCIDEWLQRVAGLLSHTSS